MRRPWKGRKRQQLSQQLAPMRRCTTSQLVLCECLTCTLQLLSRALHNGSSILDVVVNSLEAKGMQVAKCHWQLQINVKVTLLIAQLRAIPLLHLSTSHCQAVCEHTAQSIRKHDSRVSPWSIPRRIWHQFGHCSTCTSSRNSCSRN